MSSIRKTYKYRLYGNRRNKHLYRTIDCAGIAWNHITALQRRYYRLTGKYAHKYTITKHMAKLRRRGKNGGSFSYLQQLGSQSLQDVCLRHDKAYQAFFKWAKTREGKRKSPPQFKKVKTYHSFTLTQAGWALQGSSNHVRIGSFVYKFSKSRHIQGTVKTVTIKRDNLNKLWICFSVTQETNFSTGKTGEIGGWDFGLKDFLVDHDGKRYKHPEPYKSALKDIARLHRVLARKQKGAKARQDAKRRLARAYQRARQC